MTFQSLQFILNILAPLFHTQSQRNVPPPSFYWARILSSPSYALRGVFSRTTLIKISSLIFASESWLILVNSAHSTLPSSLQFIFLTSRFSTPTLPVPYGLVKKMKCRSPEKLLCLLSLCCADSALLTCCALPCFSKSAAGVSIWGNHYISSFTVQSTSFVYFF